MDFLKLISEQIEYRHAFTNHDREIIYRALRQRLSDAVERKGIAHDDPKALDVYAKLESAISKTEARYSTSAIDQNLFMETPENTSVYPDADTQTYTDISSGRRPLDDHNGHTPATNFRNRAFLALGALFIIVLAGAGWYFTTTPSDEQDTAVRPSIDDAAVFAISGEALNNIKPTKGTEAVLTDGVMRLTSTAQRYSPTGLGGGVVRLQPVIEQLVGGKNITVDVIAKPDETAPSPEFYVAYSTAGVGNSGWAKFKVKDGLERYSFDYDVPKPEGEPRFDYIAIWADPEAEGRGIDIVGVSISINE